MTLILDHIVTTIIVATLFFSAAATQLRVQEAGIAQVSSHAAKTKALSLGQWLDMDIVALGENVIDKSARFDNPSPAAFVIKTLEEDGTCPEQTMTYTSEWQFYSDRSNGSGKQRTATRYQLVLQTDSLKVELNGDDDCDYTRPLFQLERDTTGWKNVDPITDTATFTEADFDEDGRSVSTLSHFRIQLVDNYGEPFADTDPKGPDEASYIHVDFSMVPEFELRRGYLRELFWTTTLKVRPFWG